METVAKVLGIKAPAAQDTSAADAAITAANSAASLRQSQSEADQQRAQQRAELTIGARGKRGLLAYLSPDKPLSSTLG